MKKALLILSFLYCLTICSQETSSFFDGKTFELQYFLKDGVRENLNLSPNDYPFPPEITFSKEENTDLIFASIAGYCNGTTAKYEVENNFLKIIERGGTTLRQCDGDEGTDIFNPITGSFYTQQPPKNVNYLITEDPKELWLWSDENHKLVFSEKVLSTVEIQLEKVISIYPNSVKSVFTIDVKSNILKIVEVLIFNSQGREVYKKYKNFKEIDVSKLSSGIYFVKMTSGQSVETIKLIKS